MRSTAVRLQLSQTERRQLEKLIRAGRAPARVQTRARILLLADAAAVPPRTDVAIARALLTSPATVGRMRRRYVAAGLSAALAERPRPGQPPKITGEVEAQLVTLACSDPPQGRARWTLQLLADRLVELQLVEAISAMAVCKRLKK